MSTFNARKGNTSGVGLSSTGTGGPYQVRNIVNLATSGASSGGVIAANDIIQVLTLPQETWVHAMGVDVQTVNTSAGSMQLSAAGFVVAAATNGNISAVTGQGGFVVSAAIFPFFNSAASTVELVLTSGTISAADGVVRVYAVLTNTNA